MYNNVNWKDHSVFPGRPTSMPQGGSPASLAALVKVMVGGGHCKSSHKYPWRAKSAPVVHWQRHIICLSLCTVWLV